MSVFWGLFLDVINFLVCLSSYGLSYCILEGFLVLFCIFNFSVWEFYLFFMEEIELIFFEVFMFCFLFGGLFIKDLLFKLGLGDVFVEEMDLLLGGWILFIFLIFLFWDFFFFLKLWFFWILLVFMLFLIFMF